MGYRKVQSMGIAVRKEGPLGAALLGAGLAFAFGMITSYWSNYASRRDQHAQESDKCTGLSASLLTTALLIREFGVIDAADIVSKAPPNNQARKFLFPPLDEIIHAQYQSIDLLDYKTRDWVMRLEQYYRGIRDDMSNTSSLYHTGETFGVYTPEDKILYKNLLDLLVKEADHTIEALSVSHHCKDLARTSFFWPTARREPTR